MKETTTLLMHKPASCIKDLADGKEIQSIALTLKCIERVILNLV
ncbi:hypothetical protein AOR13_1104 [Alteromonas stellipolaris LMG 21856]|nr:hypothetical protein AOR13_1104 [Alteromonas stellipolaris LMG 21856]